MSRNRRRLPGRFCWCCGQRRANEGFSRKLHVCSRCKKLGKEEVAFRQHARNIDRLFSPSGLLKRTQRRTFEKYLAHADPRVRAHAEYMRAFDESIRRERREVWEAMQAQEDLWEALSEYDEACLEHEETRLAEEEELALAILLDRPPDA